MNERADQLARLLLLLVFAAFFVNVVRGTGRQWLRAKFIGKAPPPPARTVRPPVGARGPVGVGG